MWGQPGGGTHGRPRAARLRYLWPLSSGHDGTDSGKDKEKIERSRYFYLSGGRRLVAPADLIAAARLSIRAP